LCKEQPGHAFGVIIYNERGFGVYFTTYGRAYTSRYTGGASGIFDADHGETGFRFGNISCRDIIGI
jgi:hypothetical protein